MTPHSAVSRPGVVNGDQGAAAIPAAVDRLNGQLPLLERQRALDPELRAVHKAILRSLAETGRPPGRQRVRDLLKGQDAAAALERLRRDDLVVCSEAAGDIVGAYPMTVEATPHHLEVEGQPVNAMCALDALSVGPMFGKRVEIHSRCHISRVPIHIVQQGLDILMAAPSEEVRVGVRWQDPTGHAAHSMCLEMVFLRDDTVARAWHGGDMDRYSVFTLPEAAAFGAGFFKPLLEVSAA